MAAPCAMSGHMLPQLGPWGRTLAGSIAVFLVKAKSTVVLKNSFEDSEKPQVDYYNDQTER